MNNTKRISFFELKLTEYMINNHPEKITEKNFIKERSDEAAIIFEEESKRGRNVEDAKEIAEKHLFSGLIFSLYNFIYEIIESEFDFVKEEERSIFTIQMIQHTKSISIKYDIEDDFMGTYEACNMRTEMIGSIKEYLETIGID